MIRIEKATEAHIEQISGLIRKIDRDEIWSAGHITPEESIRLGLSGEAYTCWFDEDIACIFGCKPVTLLGDTACPWMIATAVIEKKPKTFLRHCKPLVSYWQEQYETLVNYADDRNEIVKKWVSWLGFTLYPPEPYGYEGMPFRKFERVRNV